MSVSIFGQTAKTATRLMALALATAVSACSFTDGKDTATHAIILGGDQFAEIFPIQAYGGIPVRAAINTGRVDAWFPPGEHNLDYVVHGQMANAGLYLPPVDEEGEPLDDSIARDDLANHVVRCKIYLQGGVIYSRPELADLIASAGCLTPSWQLVPQAITLVPNPRAEDLREEGEGAYIACAANDPGRCSGFVTSRR